MLIAVLTLVWTTVACTPDPPQAVESLPVRETVSLDALGIPVVAADNRPVSFTNKRSAYFYTQSHLDDHPEHAGFSGLNIAQQRVFAGYDIRVDGRRLDPAAAEVTVYPDRLQRRWGEGITATLRLFDNLDLVEIEIAGADGPVEVSPLGEGVALLSGDGRLRVYSTMEAPGRVIAAGNHGPRHYLVVAATAEEAGTLFDAAATAARAWRERRERRLEGLLNGYAFVQADDAELEKALRWLVITMDQLVTRQRGDGIYAGLPWFNEYWGRDSFIALPGALLVTGQFETARAVLTAFAEFMDMDPSSPFYGRVPNRVRMDDLDYHTTDGTPRFVVALQDYVRYSGDLGIVEELYPQVRASIEGALANWTDDDGYLTHEENETWMDARRQPDLAAYSPRDTRANDIQALWHGQLLAGAWFAGVVGDADSANRWREIAGGLAARFERDFTDPQYAYLADRLDADDRPDFSLRPNQLYALDMVADEITVARAARAAWENLVYPWGVASLAAGDPFFHPYHLAPAHYHKDQAYHNGTVWLWNNGIAMQRMIELGQVEPAWALFTNMNRQALERGVVGGMAENMDAWPHPGEDWPRLTGTYLQAWSNSEQLRTWYQHFLGVRPDLVRGHVTLAPRLPPEAGGIAFGARIGQGWLEAEYRPADQGWNYRWKLHGAPARLRLDLPGFAVLEIDALEGDLLTARVQADRLAWSLQGAAGERRRQGSAVADPGLLARQAELDAVLHGTRFAAPGDPMATPVMQGSTGDD
jgi:glycogen debranching enzyme